MRHDPDKLRFDMLRAARRIAARTRGMTVEQFLADLDATELVRWHFVVIGEAMYQLDKHHPSAAARFSEYERISGFRHVLVHAYDTIDDSVVWRTISTKLPILIAELEREIGPPPADPSPPAEA